MLYQCDVMLVVKVFPLPKETYEDSDLSIIGSESWFELILSVKKW